MGMLLVLHVSGHRSENFDLIVALNENTEGDQSHSSGQVKCEAHDSKEKVMLVTVVRHLRAVTGQSIQSCWDISVIPLEPWR